jgi:cytochrome c oxidase subunit 2
VARTAHQLAAAPSIEPADRGLATGLWIWAVIIVAGLLVLAIGSFLVERSLSAAREREALQVRVTGHQWWWRIEYRDPASGGWIETANELHLPAGRTARIVLGSADVIHSFWVPNVAGKMDMSFPAARNVLDVSPHRIGWFRGQCAEFCGAQHAHMAFDVKVDSPAEFAAWLAAQARPATAPIDPVIARGMAVVTGGPCAACHVVRGSRGDRQSGPRPDAFRCAPINRGRYAADEPRRGLKGWIAQPQALKPGTMMPAVALRRLPMPTPSSRLSGFAPMTRCRAQLAALARDLGRPAGLVGIPHHRRSQADRGALHPHRDRC